MVKRIIRLSLILLIGLLVIAWPASAVSVTNATYVADVVAVNVGDATSNVAAVCDINTEALINGKYVTSDLLNTALQTSGGTDIAYMPGIGADPWVFFIPTSIGANEQKSYLFYAGGPAMQTGFSYFPESGGMTTPDNDVSLELGNNFEIEQRGWVDTSSGADKNLVYKQGAFKVYVSAASSLSSMIIDSTAYPTIAAVDGGYDSIARTSHTFNLPSGIVPGNLLLVYFTTASNPTVTFPGGWTQLFNTSNSTFVTHGCWYRVADGTEGETITITTSTSQYASSTSYRVTGYLGVPEASTAVTGSSTTPNPPNLTPSWGAQNTLWLASTGHMGNANVSAAPTNYTDKRQDGPSGYCVTGTARRNLNAVSENPGTFTLSASMNWVANTIAVKPDEVALKEVTAAGVTSGVRKVVVTATGGGTGLFTISVYDENDVLIDDDSVALGSTSVPPNGNNWSFLTNGSMVYMNYHKITINGIPVQHIVYERDTTFDDLTTYNNDATPTFRTTSSDPDVSATFQNFRPTNEAIISVGGSEETPEMLTETPEMPSEFYAEGETEHLPGAEVVNEVLTFGGVPLDLFWIPFLFGIAAAAAVVSYRFVKSILFISIIAGVTILFFALTGAISLWTFFEFIIIAAGINVSERVFGW